MTRRSAAIRPFCAGLCHPGLRILSLVLTSIMLLSCASSGGGAPELEIVIRQMPDNYELLAFPGPIAIRYQVTVGNPTDNAITMERLQLRSNGPGPYTVPQLARSVGIEIAAGEIVTFDFVVDGVSRGDERIMREPVTLSGTAYFRSDEGPVSKSFIQIIRGISQDQRNSR